MVSAEKRGKKWRGRYYAPDGKRRDAGTATTKRQAPRLAEEQEYQIRHGLWADPSNKTPFGEYFPEWLKHRHFELSTKLTHQNSFDTSIGEEFGAMRVAAITRVRVQAWVDRMAANGVSPATVETRLNTLRT